MTYRYVAHDRMGIPRVYGDGPSPDVAETECRQAVLEYCQHRPDKRVDEFTVQRAT